MLGQRWHVALCIRCLCPDSLCSLGRSLSTCDPASRQTTCRTDQIGRKFNFPFKKIAKVNGSGCHAAFRTPSRLHAFARSVKAVQVVSCGYRQFTPKMFSDRYILCEECCSFAVTFDASQGLGNHTVGCQWRFFDMFFLHPSTPESHKIQGTQNFIWNQHRNLVK